MRAIQIIAEGPTEKLFIDDCLQPYLYEQYGVYDVQACLLGPSGHQGGNVKAVRILKDIGNLMKQRQDTLITTFLDYYKIGTDLPNYTNCQNLLSTDQRIDCLEDALYQQIASSRFVPYIQKHEFEALLFSSGAVLTSYLSLACCKEIDSTRQNFNNPEDINTVQPPSFRLSNLFKQHEGRNYKKTSSGHILALEIGIYTMLNQCPRFATWVHKIGEKAQKDY